MNATRPFKGRGAELLVKKIPISLVGKSIKSHVTFTTYAPDNLNDVV